jgi:hypothetical protein
MDKFIDQMVKHHCATMAIEGNERMRDASNPETGGDR